MARKATGSGKKASGGSAVWELKLYVAGDNINGKNAIAQIKKICVAYLYSNCHIEVIDLMKNPKVALKEHIVALPMLVRTSPGPKITLVGDLSDREKVLRSLEIERYNGL